MNIIDYFYYKILYKAKKNIYNMNKRLLKMIFE